MQICFICKSFFFCLQIESKSVCLQICFKYNAPFYQPFREEHESDVSLTAASSSLFPISRPTSKWLGIEYQYLLHTSQSDLYSPFLPPPRIVKIGTPIARTFSFFKCKLVWMSQMIRYVCTLHLVFQRLGFLPSFNLLNGLRFHKHYAHSKLNSLIHWSKHPLSQVAGKTRRTICFLHPEDYDWRGSVCHRYSELAIFSFNLEDQNNIRSYCTYCSGLKLGPHHQETWHSIRLKFKQDTPHGARGSGWEVALWNLESKITIESHATPSTQLLLETLAFVTATSRSHVPGFLFSIFASCAKGRRRIVMFLWGSVEKRVRGNHGCASPLHYFKVFRWRAKEGWNV